MWLPCWSLAYFPQSISCETGSFSHCGNCHSPQPALSFSFPLSQPLPRSLASLLQLAPSPWSATSLWVLSICCLFSLVVLLDCFFNSVVVGAPCSLIFWHFWFIDFRLSSFWLCEEAKGFYLHLHLGRNSPVNFFVVIICAFAVISNKLLYNPKSLRVTPMFSSVL